MIRAPLLLVLSVVLLPILGCGMGGRGNVRGRVTYNDKPIGAPDFVISFVGPDKLPITAPIDVDGKYQLADIHAGPNKVIVFYRSRAAKGSNTKRNEEIDDPARNVSQKKTFQLPEQYSDLVKSTLSCTVEAGSLNTFDIVMTGPPLPGP